MDLAVQEVCLLTGGTVFLIFLPLLLGFYRYRLLSHSLKLCNWICGMAISSDSPWVKMLVLHLIFFIRLLMYFAIVSLEQVDRLTAGGFLKQYLSGTRIVVSEHMLSFLHSPEKFEKYVLSLDVSPVNKKDQHLRK